MKLVDDVGDWWRWWSLRLAALGTAITSVLILWPDWALFLWNAMPPEVRALLPQRYVPLIGVIIFGMSMLARIVKQKKPRRWHEA